MSLAGVAVICINVYFVVDYVQSAVPGGMYAMIAVVFVGTLYLAFVAYLVRRRHRVLREPDAVLRARDGRPVARLARREGAHRGRAVDDGVGRWTTDAACECRRC